MKPLLEAKYQQFVAGLGGVESGMSLVLTLQCLLVGINVHTLGLLGIFGAVHPPVLLGRCGIIHSNGAHYASEINHFRTVSIATNQQMMVGGLKHFFAICNKWLVGFTFFKRGVETTNQQMGSGTPPNGWTCLVRCEQPSTQVVCSHDC